MLGKNKKWWLLLFAVVFLDLLGLTLFFKNGYLPKNKSIECEDCNVVMVSLDVLGAKHLPCYGYERDTAENLCEFGKENIFFENVYVNSPGSLPSHTSFFTGLYPSEHKVVIPGKDKLKSETDYLPRIMQKVGYVNVFKIPEEEGAMLSKEVVGDMAVDEYLNYDDRLAGELKKVKSLNDEGRKVFMFLHNYKVHSPYTLEKGEELRYVDDLVEEVPLYVEDFYKVDEGFVDYFLRRFEERIRLGICGFEEDECWELLREVEKVQNDEKRVKNLLRNRGYAWDYFYDYNYYRKIDVTDEKHIGQLRGLYDQEIYSLDQEMGRFFKNFYELGLDKNTILIVTSGHGEEFMEHGGLGHLSLYDEVMKVPLFVYVPGVEGRKINERVQGVDLFSTILDLVGVEFEKKSGLSLKDLMMGEGKRKFEMREVVLDGVEMEDKGLVRGDWKLILRKDRAGKFLPVELYNLRDDPEEERDVLLENYELINKMFVRYGNI